MKKIDFQNNVTKVNKATFDEFQNNIEEAVNEVQNNIDTLDRIIVSSTEPTTNEKVWIKKGKNLFNKNKYIVDTDGKIGFELNLKLGETYTLSSNKPLYVAKFSTNSYTNSDNVGPQKWSEFTSWTFIAGNNVNNYLNNTLYLGVVSDTISSNIEDFADYNIQIEQGSTATEYEPYIEKEIYVKNDSGAYDKFVNIETMGIKTITGTKGTAVLYPDGTMICSGTFHASGINTEVWNESYGALVENPVTFLINFAKVNSVVVNCVQQAHAFWVHRVVFDTSGITNIEISRPGPATNAGAYFSYIAMGTWK